jgi:hypothetical protein
VLSKEEFAKIVREMQAAGTPLSVRNLMVRTELPRATVEAWLEELQSGAEFVPRAEAKRADGDAKGAQVKDRASAVDAVESLFSKAKSLKDEVVGDVVKTQLGMESSESKAGKDKKSIATGAILGLIFPPAMFAYAAPILEGIAASIVYLLVVIGVQKIPLIGTLIGMYVVLALNLLGAFLGLAYTFRYNRNGKRMPLLPRPKQD